MTVDRELLIVLVPLIAAPLTTLIVQLLKRASAWLARQTDTVKRLVTLVVALVLNFVGFKLGVVLPDQQDEVTVEAVTTVIFGILSALSAMGLYHFKPRPVTTPATNTEIP